LFPGGLRASDPPITYRAITSQEDRTIRVDAVADIFAATPAAVINYTPAADNRITYRQIFPYYYLRGVKD
jgi:hypothetical protein